MNPTLVTLILIGLIGGLAWIGLLLRLDRDRQQAPIPTWSMYLFWRGVRIYARVMHHARFEGLEQISDWRNDPATRPENGSLIVVANHTSGVDPFLVNAAVRFEIRWMMMTRMNVGFIRIFTHLLRIILVDQDGRDMSATREALRHLRNGGILGVFPEGQIERPPERLRRFEPGVGFLVAKSKAPVLPVWISGTPFAETSLESFRKTSRARIVYGPIMTFDPDDDPRTITDRLRHQIQEMSGWPSEENGADDRS